MVWHITAKGYRRGNVDGRQRLEHDVVWERAHGPIPKGLHIHHIDGDKQNNALDNLIAVDSVAHKRIHSGCELRDGAWWKRCNKCDQWKPLDPEHFYFGPEGWPLYGRCKPCHIRIVVEAKRVRRMRKGGDAK